MKCKLMQKYAQSPLLLKFMLIFVTVLSEV